MFGAGAQWAPANFDRLCKLIDLGWVESAQPLRDGHPIRKDRAVFHVITPSSLSRGAAMSAVVRNGFPGQIRWSGGLEARRRMRYMRDLRVHM